MKRKGIYTLKLRVAAASDTGKVSVLVEGKPIAKGLNILDTGGETGFQFITIKEVPLKTGKHTMKILTDASAFSFSYFQFIRKE